MTSTKTHDRILLVDDDEIILDPDLLRAHLTPVERTGHLHKLLEGVVVSPGKDEAQLRGPNPGRDT